MKRNTQTATGKKVKLIVTFALMMFASDKHEIVRYETNARVRVVATKEN